MTTLLRTGFALVLLMERYLMSTQMDVLFYPSIGLLPTETSRQHAELKNDFTAWTLFQLAPHSDKLVDILFRVGVVHGILLLVGFFPRWQIVGLLFNLVCWQNHNAMVWEASDTLFRVYAFTMLFLPIHKYGLSDWILHHLFYHNDKNENKRKQKDDDASTTTQTDSLSCSWPMWPYRLFQGLLTLIYLSTALSVWKNKLYYSGDFLFYIRNSDHWNPMWGGEMLNQALDNIVIAHCVTWTAMALFSTSWWLVWIVPSSCYRKLIVATMVCFHLFLETVTNTAFMNTLLALGWLTFLVQPNPSLRPAAPTSQIVATFLVALLVLTVTIDSFPLEIMTEYLPYKLQSLWDSVVVEIQYDLYHYIEPALLATGLYQGIWDISYLHEPHERISFEAYLTFSDDSEYIWSSPDFKSMSWLEKRQHGRIINYFAALPTTSASAAAVKLCDKLRASYGREEMVQCELVHQLESDPLPPPKVTSDGMFRPTSDEMERHERTIVTIHYCIDQRDDCFDLIEGHESYNICSLPEGLDACAYSCGECSPLIELSENQHYQPVSDKEDDFHGEDENDDEEKEEDVDYEPQQQQNAALTDEAKVMASVKARSNEMLSELLDDDAVDEYDDENEYESDQHPYEDEVVCDECEEEAEYDEREGEDYGYDEDNNDDDDIVDTGGRVNNNSTAPSAAYADQAQSAEEELDGKRSAATVAVGGSKVDGKEASLLVTASNKEKHEERGTSEQCEGTDYHSTIHKVLIKRGQMKPVSKQEESDNA